MQNDPLRDEIHDLAPSGEGPSGNAASGDEADEAATTGVGSMGSERAGRVRPGEASEAAYDDADAAADPASPSGT